MLTYKDMECLVIEYREAISNCSSIKLASRYKKIIKELELEIAKRKARKAKRAALSSPPISRIVGTVVFSPYCNILGICRYTPLFVARHSF